MRSLINFFKKSPKLLLFILIYVSFLANNGYALPESISKASLRVPLKSAKKSVKNREESLEILLLDDNMDQIEWVETEFKKIHPSIKIYPETGRKYALELLRKYPDIRLLVVDFQLAGYDKGNTKDNGVTFCRSAFEELGFTGNAIIFSREDKEVIEKELKLYPILWKKYEKGLISIQSKWMSSEALRLLIEKKLPVLSKSVQTCQ